VLTQYLTLDPLQTRIDTHVRYSEHADDVEEAVTPLPDQDLLDVGCCTGSFLRRLAVSGHRGRLAGVDTSHAAVAALADLHAVSVHLADAQSLPFPDGSFDAVTAWHMLYHLPDPVLAIHEAFRVLRPGGTYAATVNIAGATPLLLGLVTESVAAHGLDPGVFQIPVDSSNLPAMVSAVFGHADVERHDNAFVFDSPEPVIAYAVSCLSGFGIEPSDPRREPIVATLAARATALFADASPSSPPSPPAPQPYSPTVSRAAIPKATSSSGLPDDTQSRQSRVCGWSATVSPGLAGEAALTWALAAGARR
jgi:SAM-dependent methyltransferase